MTVEEAHPIVDVPAGVRRVACWCRSCGARLPIRLVNEEVGDLGVAYVAPCDGCLQSAEECGAARRSRELSRTAERVRSRILSEGPEAFLAQEIAPRREAFASAEDFDRKLGVAARALSEEVNAGGSEGLSLDTTAGILFLLERAAARIGEGRRDREVLEDRLHRVVSLAISHEAKKLVGEAGGCGLEPKEGT